MSYVIREIEDDGFSRDYVIAIGPMGGFHWGSLNRAIQFSTEAEAQAAITRRDANRTFRRKTFAIEQIPTIPAGETWI